MLKKIPQIYNLAFFISHKCNLRCSYCFEDHNRIEEMSRDMIKKVYKFFKTCDKLKKSRLEIFGGEPTLNQELFLYALEEYYRDPDITNRLFSMTNGTCFNREFVEKISKIISLNQNAQKDFVFHISIDDIDRGEKNLEKIKDSLILLSKHNIRYTIQLVISKKNYSRLYDIVKNIIPFISTSLNLRRLCDTSEWTSDEISVIKKECFKIIDELDCNKIIFPGKYDADGSFYDYCVDKLHKDHTIYFIDTNGDIYYCEQALAERKECLGNISDVKTIKSLPNKDIISSYTTCFLRKYNGNKLYNELGEEIQKKLSQRKLSVFFEITDICNYNCSFCCKSWKNKKYGSMKSNVLDKLANLNAKYYLITGGEPALAKEQIYYFLKKVKTNNIRINTNLSSWSKEDILELQKRNIEFTVDLPAIEKNKYIKITGAAEKDYYNTIKNLQYLKNKKTIICIVISKYNIEKYQEDILYLASKYGFNNFTITPAISVKNNIDDTVFFYGLKEFVKNHINLNITTLANVPNINNVPYSHKCSAGLDRFVVLPNGDVVPCAWNKNNVIGNILNDDMLKILKNGKSYFNKFAPKEQELCKGYIESQVNNDT